MENKPMPEMFSELQKKVKLFASKNGYSYKFWNKKKLDSLLNKYPQYKKLVNNVRYEIMKVDIMKYLILHNEGGIYLDMDLEPKLKKLKDYEFAVSTNPGTPKYNNDVIQAKKGDEKLLDVIDYIETQIKEKSKISVYDNRKFRYVLHTTGPQALVRFLKLIKYKPQEYRVNNASTNPPKMNLIGNEDFLDFPSALWGKFF